MQTGHCSQNYCPVLQQQQNKQIMIQYLRWLLLLSCATVPPQQATVACCLPHTIYYVHSSAWSEQMQRTRIETPLLVGVIMCHEF
jgi:hypothetical protein